MVRAFSIVHFYEGQWWFWDEIGLDRMGPFGTEEQANEGIEKYCVEVLNYETARMETRTMATTKEILDAVGKERERQHRLALGGDTDTFDRSNSRNDWVAYISAYAGRAAAKVARNEIVSCHFRSMMVKVAALAVAAIEANDKGWMDAIRDPQREIRANGTIQKTSPENMG